MSSLEKIFPATFRTVFAADSASKQVPSIYRELGEKQAPQEEKSVSSFLSIVDIRTFDTFNDMVGYENDRISFGLRAETFANKVLADKTLNAGNTQGQKNAEKFLQDHLVPAKWVPNLMLYGPSGTGKTTFMGAIAREVQKYLGKVSLTVYRLNAGAVKDSLVGGSEKNITEALDRIKTGPKPAIVIIDEADSLIGTGRFGAHETTHTVTGIVKAKISEFAEINGLMVLAATNHIDKIDTAIKAPHRFVMREIGVPDDNTKYRMLKRSLEALGVQVDVSQDELKQLSRTMLAGKAVAASFKALGAKVQETLAITLRGVREGMIPVIVRSNNGKKETVVSPAGMSLENARAHSPRIDPAGGDGAFEDHELGLTIKTSSGKLTSASITGITSRILRLTLARFEESQAENLKIAESGK